MPFGEGMGALEHSLGSGSGQEGISALSTSKRGSNGSDNPRARPREGEQDIPRCSTTAAGESPG